jgi:[NiFe] hydrogenase assembly HybE family chaperone
MDAPTRENTVLLDRRVAELQALFLHIAATRMDGVPILNPALRVQAVGFEPVADAAAGIGVLITPWFMNLVWLPLDPETADAAAPGVTRDRRVGNDVFPFIGASESGFGRYEVCSLFSPMFEFVDHDAALATAMAVLEELRRPLPAPPKAPDRSRRALLMGRDAAGASP